MAKRPSQPQTKRPMARPASAQTAAAPVSTPAAPATAWTAPTVPRSSVVEWLTVERVLWATLLALAAAVRVLDLARFSLTDAEASLANAALAILRGDPEGALHVSPFAAGVNAILFTLFGANDVTARILSVSAGIAMVALTFRMRSALGRWGALIAALLFALSTTFLFESRTANGETVAIAGVYAALVGMWSLLREANARAILWIAAGMGVALAAGELAWLFVLIVVSFAAILYILRRTQQLDIAEFESALSTIKQSPVLMRHALILFALVFVAGATGALLNPLGLQSALSLAGDVFTRWLMATNQPASYYLQLLSVYELLPLAFGLGGLFYYLARGERFAPFLAWWLGLSLTWFTLAPFKSGSALLLMLVPLILVAGRAIADVLASLARGFTLANDGVFMALGVLTCGIFGINLFEFAQTTQQSHLLVAGIALVMLLLIGALVGGLAQWISADALEPDTLALRPDGERAEQPRAWRFNLPRALTILGTITLIGLTALFLHSSFNLSFNTGDDPRELMSDAPTTMEARELKPMLEALSSRWEGDPHRVAIAADANIGPALRWYLRDFARVHEFRDTPATLGEPIVIVASTDKQPALDNYAMHKMRWRWLKPAQPFDTQSFLRWQLYRGIHDVPASFDIIVYAQMR